VEVFWDTVYISSLC